MINIYRYSNLTNSFRPQYHYYLYERSLVDRNSLLKNETNPHMINLINNIYCTPDPLFEFDGTFVFLNDPQPKDKRYNLNPFRRRPKHTHKKQIEKERFCYIDDGVVFRPQNRMTIEQARDEKHHMIYIPASQSLYIREIRHRTKFGI